MDYNQYYLKNISLYNFRNHKKFFSDFSSSCNIIIGSNGSGKTSILEAISLLSVGKGLKSAEVNNIIGYGGIESKIHSDLNTSLGLINLGVFLEFDSSSESFKKKYFIDENKVKNKEYLLHSLDCVWMIPQMDNFFLQDSSVKRKFIDKLISVLDKDHLIRLIEYEKLLKERSKVLFMYSHHHKWLDIIEENICSIGVALSVARANFLEQLSEELSDNSIYKYPMKLMFEGMLEDLFKEHKFSLVVEGYYKASLKNSRENDKKTNTTTIGPHKSKLQGHSIKHSRLATMCSSGEQKILLIEMIVSFINLVFKIKKSKPVLLLDEINIHLDQENSDYIVNCFLNLGNQIFITSVDNKYFVDNKNQFNFIKL